MAKAEISGVPGGPVVIMKLDAYGAAEFERLTASNVNRYLAICINDQVITAPMVIQSVTSNIKMGAIVKKVSRFAEKVLNCSPPLKYKHLISNTL